VFDMLKNDVLTKRTLLIHILDSDGDILLTKEFDSLAEGYRFYNQKMIPGENGIPENAVSKKLVSKEVKTTMRTLVIRDMDEVNL
jgi:hypothetical protein